MAGYDNFELHTHTYIYVLKFLYKNINYMCELKKFYHFNEYEIESKYPWQDKIRKN